jgi:hypothetical protein
MNRYICGAVAAAFIAVAGACSDPNAIANASIGNVVDTVTLFALTDGPLLEPTAYSVAAKASVRTWEAGNSFDFAFDETSGGAPVFLPTSVLGLLSSSSFKPGLKRPGASTTFDEMVKAPSNDYIVSDTIPIAVGDRFYIRTTISACSFLSVPEYGKLEVLELDPVAHTVKMQVVANQNCGYRSLKLGIPKS